MAILIAYALSPSEFASLRRPTSVAAGVTAGLPADCERTAHRLRSQLGADCNLVVHSPFVIAGDLAGDALNGWYQKTIRPAAHAMRHGYFKTPPDQPITILLFSDETTYRACARRLFSDEQVSIYGYYKPLERTLVMNISTGGGTLVHELTHALIAFDFPRVPAWFNEGLASLHEQCSFRGDESGIDGLPNWRLPILKTAISAGKLRPLKSLIGDDDFREGSVGLNYAQARYFCLFMQHRGVLEEFYRFFRDNQHRDPLGLAAVQRVFPDRTWRQLDADFQAWATELGI